MKPPPSDSLPFTLELPQLTKVKGTHLRTKKKGVSFASDFGGENDYSTAPMPPSKTPKSNPAISSFLSQAEELVSQAESALERAESIDRDVGVQERQANPVDKDYLEYSTFAGPHKISAGMRPCYQF